MIGWRPKLYHCSLLQSLLSFLLSLPLLSFLSPQTPTHLLPIEHSPIFPSFPLLLQVISFSSFLTLNILVLQEKDVIGSIHFKFSYQFTNLRLNSFSFLKPYVEYSILTSAVTYFLLSKILGRLESNIQPGKH